MRSSPVRMTRSATAADWVLLGVLALIWGTAFLFTKVAVATIPPMTVAAGRLSIAALVLVSAALAAGQGVPRGRSRWSSFAAMAIVGNAAPFFLISWGQVVVDSAVAGVLMAAMPLVTIVLAHFFVESEPLRAVTLVGFTIGFAGILVLVGPSVLGRLGQNEAVALRQAAILLGAICYACNAIIARRLEPTPPLGVAAATMTLAAVVTLPIALVTERPWARNLSPGSLAAVAHLGLVATALAMTLFYRAIASAGATFLSLTNYLIPIVAVIAGVVILGEEPRWNLYAALALVLAGIAIERVGSRA
jgi:drug/metabolite transporter (DMT)-like permease